jgi:hypothetical protein
MNNESFYDHLEEEKAASKEFGSISFDNQNCTPSGLPVRAISWVKARSRWEGLIWNEGREKFVECYWDENGSCPYDPKNDLVTSHRAWRLITDIHQAVGLVRHAVTKEVYTVTSNYGTRATAVKTADITNPSEWEVLT